MYNLSSERIGGPEELNCRHIIAHHMKLIGAQIEHLDPCSTRFWRVPFVSESLAALHWRAAFSLGNSRVLKATQVEFRNLHNFFDSCLNVSSRNLTVDSE
jgi:hypothetical protein